MNISYNSHHVEITEPLKNYFEKKLSRLDSYEHLIGKVDVYFSIDSSYVHQVEMEIEFAKWKTLFFTAKDTDMYRAIDDLFDRAEKNIARLKARITDHKQQESIRKKAEFLENSNRKDNTVTEINFKEISRKPMAIIDAVHTLSPKKTRDFLFFYNYETNDDITPSLILKLGEKQFLLAEKTKFIDKLKIIKVEKTGFNKIKLSKPKEITLDKKKIDDVLNTTKEDFYFFFNLETENLSLIIKNEENGYKILNILNA